MVGGSGGHLAGVSDVSWNPEGEFLWSIGEDKTTRLHACVVEALVEGGCGGDDGGGGDKNGAKARNGDTDTTYEKEIKNTNDTNSLKDTNIGVDTKNAKDTNTKLDSKDESDTHWCQISRPQMHGYRINALAAVSRF